MCGVHATVLIPSATNILAMASDISSSRAPSSMPGSKWLCKSIMLSAPTPPIFYDAVQYRLCLYTGYNDQKRAM
jgi:hypothetical protein